MTGTFISGIKRFTDPEKLCKYEVKKFTTNLTNPYFVSVTFRTCFCSPFPSFLWKNQDNMYYNKGIIIRDIGNVQFLDQEESKSNSTLT